MILGLRNIIADMQRCKRATKTGQKDLGRNYLSGRHATWPDNMGFAEGELPWTRAPILRALTEIICDSDGDRGKGRGKTTVLIRLHEPATDPLTVFSFAP